MLQPASIILWLIVFKIILCLNNTALLGHSTFCWFIMNNAAMNIRVQVFVWT